MSSEGEEEEESGEEAMEGCEEEEVCILKNSFVYRQLEMLYLLLNILV